MWHFGMWPVVALPVLGEQLDSMALEGFSILNFYNSMIQLLVQAPRAAQCPHSVLTGSSTQLGKHLLLFAQNNEPTVKTLVTVLGGMGKSEQAPPDFILVSTIHLQRAGAAQGEKEEKGTAGSASREWKSQGGPWDVKKRGNEGK